MAGDLFSRNRRFHLLGGFYTEWSEHLTKNCLPLLRNFPPSAANNHAVLNALISYYDTIDHYANRDTIFHFLFPTWHVNSLETSVLFLGDVHPHLFVSLVQSFRDPNRSHGDLAAWRALAFPGNLFLDNIKNEISDTVFRLLREMREAQEGFIQGCSDNWVSSFHSQRGKRSVTVVETVSSVTLSEEFVRIFHEANQLRKAAIREIVDLINENQAALFLEGVCEFLAGFKHQQQQPYGPIQAQLPPPNYSAQHQPEQLHDICVWNIDLNVTRDMLGQMFRHYPSVRGVRIENDTGRRQRHGFVSFADEREKWRAVQEMNGAMLLNKPMHIRCAAHSNN